MKKAWIIFALVLAGGVAFAQPAGDLLTVAPSEPVITVNGHPIPAGELLSEMATRYGQATMRLMVEALLVEIKAGQEEITASSSEIDERLAGVKEEHGGDDGFNAWLIQQGRTLGSVRDDLKRAILFQKLVDAETTVTDDEVQAFYESNRELLNLSERAHVFGIFLTNQRAAEQLTKTVSPANFEVFAGMVSEDDESKVKNGDLGWIAPGDPSSIGQAIVGMEPNHVSGVVADEHGYWLLLVKEAREPDFAEIRDQVRAIVVEQRTAANAASWFDRARRTVNVQTFIDLAAKYGGNSGD